MVGVPRIDPKRFAKKEPLIWLPVVIKVTKYVWFVIVIITIKINRFNALKRDLT